jgi:transcriptional regulator with XRE-family HTH domain
MEQDRIDQGIRLQKLAKALNLNQSSLAKSLGTTQPNISRMVTGESKISSEVMLRILNLHKNVNVHWLLTGEGSMFVDGQADPATQVKEVADPYRAKTKGKLEDLEERIEKLEETVQRLVKKLNK